MYSQSRVLASGTPPANIQLIIADGRFSARGRKWQRAAVGQDARSPRQAARWGPFFLTRGHEGKKRSGDGFSPQRRGSRGLRPAVSPDAWLLPHRGFRHPCLDGERSDQRSGKTTGFNTKARRHEELPEEGVMGDTYSRRDVPVAKVLFNDTGINSGRRGTQGGGDGEGQDGQDGQTFLIFRVKGRFCAGCRRSMGMGRIPYFGVVHGLWRCG